jgi:RNA polymerase-binding transcription factor
MNDKTSVPEKTFLDRQRARLLKLHTELSTTAKAAETEERGVQDRLLGEAQEFEDDAQRLSLLDTEDSLISRNIQRLPRIERALEKLDDGTYGFSDASGKPIARDRLEAIPEAIYTVEEEATHGSEAVQKP